MKTTGGKWSWKFENSGKEVLRDILVESTIRNSAQNSTRVFVSLRAPLPPAGQPASQPACWPGCPAVCVSKHSFLFCIHLHWPWIHIRSHDNMFSFHSIFCFLLLLLLPPLWLGPRSIKARNLHFSFRYQYMYLSFTISQRFLLSPSFVQRDFCGTAWWIGKIVCFEQGGVTVFPSYPEAFSPRCQYLKAKKNRIFLSTAEAFLFFLCLSYFSPSPPLLFWLLWLSVNNAEVELTSTHTAMLTAEQESQIIKFRQACRQFAAALPIAASSVFPFRVAVSVRQRIRNERHEWNSLTFDFHSTSRYQ